MNIQWLVKPSAVRLTAIYIMFVMLLACNNTSPQIVATQMTALHFGELVKVNGCFRVNDREANTSHLLVWPTNLTVKTGENAIRITDENDNEISLHIGDKMRLSGGEVHSVTSLDLQQNGPVNCPGPFWIVSSVELFTPSK